MSMEPHCFETCNFLFPVDALKTWGKLREADEAIKLVGKKKHESKKQPLKHTTITWSSIYHPSCFKKNQRFFVVLCFFRT